MSTPSIVRVLSWNVHKGFSPLGTRFVLSDIKALIREQNVDFALIQEVVGNHRRLPIGEQLEFLADQVWPHYAYGQNAIYDEGHHGNAILSRWPITETHNTDISAHALEQRGILYAKVERAGLHLLCTHFGLLPHWRTEQLTRLKACIEKLPPGEPVIVAGDFNEPLAVLSEGLKKLGFQEAPTSATFPSLLPLLRLDRVYYRGLTLRQAHTLSSTRLWGALSDHLPVVIELEL